MNDERAAEIQKYFDSQLKTDEKYIWCGKTDDSATMKECNDSPKSFVGPIFVIAFSVIFMVVCFIGGSIGGLFVTPFLICGIVMLKRTTVCDKYYYAITNQRVLSYDGTTVRSINLEKIRSLNVISSERDIGYILFNYRKVEVIKTYNDNTGNYEAEEERTDGGLYGIKEPYKVERILRGLIKTER